MPSARRNRWLLFFILFLSYGYFFQSGQDNENARFCQVRAIVERGTLQLDRFNANSADLIEYEGNLYPNKIPGTTFLAIPAFFYSAHLLRLLPITHAIWEHLVCYFTTWFTVGLLSAGLGVVLFLVLEKILQSTQMAFLLTLAYGLGTIAFPFSTLFFSHQATASLLFISFAMLFFLKEEPFYQKNTQQILFVSGFCAGYSVTSEYPAALGVLLITLYALLVLPKRKWNVWFWAGIIFGGSFLILYNLLVSGKIYFVPYSVYRGDENSSFPEHKIGFMGVGMPKWRTLLEITFLPQRGLFLCNPWLLLSLPALFLSATWKTYRNEFILCALMVIAFFTFNAGYGVSIAFWGGGASVGPRHIIPMLPFCVVLIAPLMNWKVFRIIFYSLSLISVAIMLMATSIEPRIPYEYVNPIKNFYWDHFKAAQFAIHPYGVFNSIPTTIDSVSFNIAKLLGIIGYLQLIPLFIFWIWGLQKFLKRLESEQLVLPNMMIPSLPAKRMVMAVSVFLFLLSLIPITNAMIERRVQGGQHGLIGTYYYGYQNEVIPPASVSDWSKDQHTIAMKRLDPRLHFNWVETGPPLSVPFITEWRGKIQIPEDGEYGFATISDDGSSVYVDQKLIVNNWGAHSMLFKSGNVPLKSGKHDIVIHYYNVGLGAGMIFQWARPGHAMEDVPTFNLYP